MPFFFPSIDSVHGAEQIYDSYVPILPSPEMGCLSHYQENLEILFYKIKQSDQSSTKQHLLYTSAIVTVNWNAR